MVKVSVIIPTYNCSAYVGEAVESVLAQSYRDFELIVIDDGSTDETAQTLQAYGDRLHYVRQENQGESVARNHGIRLARGEYVAFLDSDDRWLPDKLSLQIAALESVPEAVLSYGYSYIIDADGNRISHRGADMKGWGEPGLHELFEHLVMWNCVGNPNTVVVRKTYLREAGIFFDPSIQWGEDWDLWLRLALQGPFYFIAKPLACYRIRRKGRRLQIEASRAFIEQNLRILNKAFAQLPADQVSKYGALRAHAFEALYLRTAIYNFELHNLQVGVEYLADAEQVRQGLTARPVAFARRLAEEGVRIAGSQRDFAAGKGFIKLVFANLPHTLHRLRRYQNRALAEFHMAAAFDAFSHHERRSTLAHIVAALAFAPICAGNLGLISIGLQSVVGSRLAFWARRERHG